MSEIRVSDPSRLHLKKELTQIRKAARVLRDPGTTSSWKSPLSSSRSVAAAMAAPASASAAWRKQFEIETVRQNGNGDTHLDSQLPFRIQDNTNVNGKDRKVFLCNWENKKSKNVQDDGSSSVEESVDDSLSDARNGVDSRSDYLGQSRSSPMIFRSRDSNLASLVTPSTQMVTGTRKKSKKTSTHLDALSKYQHQDMVLARNLVNSRKLLNGHPSMALGLSRDDSVDQSDDTEEYSNSEDLRKFSGSTPLLLKLKHKNWSHSSSKLLRSSLKEDSSYTYSTPALSTSSYNRHANRNPSTVGSWDATTASLNDADDEIDDHLDLPGRQGCGIPCYWSKRTPKHRGMCGSCYSPSLSDTLRRKGGSILCGSQTMYGRQRRSSSVSDKRKVTSRRAQGLLPFLTNSGDGRGGSSIGTGLSDDELSTNFGELDLEALSRLDGRRWSSSCRSQDGLEIVALNREGEVQGTPENIRSLSQKYRPMFFNELIGQNIVIQSLVNAVSRRRIAPVYLFQGPRGTGKTSTARIFAAALNCLGNEETMPCGYCSACTDFISGKNRDFWEVDSTDKKGIDKVRYLLKNLYIRPQSTTSRYKVFVIDECHLLPSKTWLAFLKFLEEPPSQVVFIFITTDLDNVPRTIQSRCQKYLFNKIKDGDIVARLRKISADENLDVESDALDLIAFNADGSLRDAETMLDQLSLLGKRITASLVNELVGVVSDEKLLELLDLALSSDTAETVKRARELMDSGVDPIVLMSQLASLIMDIIAGTRNIVDAKFSDSLFGGQSLTEAEVERLKHALKLLSEAEKQLRVSSERSTWFTATLLQLGSVPSPDLTQSGSSRRQSSKATEEDPSSTSWEAPAYKQKSGAQYVPRKSISPASLYKAIKGSPSHQGKLLSKVGEYSPTSVPSSSQFLDGGDTSVTSSDSYMVGNMIFTCTNSDKLQDIWAKCIERCHSKTLKQLLQAYGNLLSVSEFEGGLVAYVAFDNGDVKSRAERFLSSITNSIEIVLRRNVEVRIILLPEGIGILNLENQIDLPEGLKQTERSAATEREKQAACPNATDDYSDLGTHQEFLKVSRGSSNDLDGKLKGGALDYPNCSTGFIGTFQSTAVSTELLSEDNVGISGTKERRQEIPMQRIESIIREQRLETAWLQAVEKGTPRSLSLLKPERNQILPQEGIYRQNLIESKNSSALSSQHLEDELNNDLKVLNINDGKMLQKDQIGYRSDHYPMSPSLLHDSSFPGSFSKESHGYESGSATGGCGALFCWNKTRAHKGRKVKGTSVRSQRGARFSLFGECGKSKHTENRFRR